MARQLICSVLLVWVCLGPIAARAEQIAPRDIWPQATALIDLAKAYGIKTFPLYAVSAAALARQASTKGNRIAVDWGYKAADTLDPGSPSVAFTRADAARDQQKGANAVPAAASGFGKLFTNYRSRLLSRSD